MSPCHYELDSLCCWFSQRRGRTPHVAAPESLPAAVTAPARWKCGAPWRMWLNGQIRSNVALLSTQNCTGYDPQIRIRPIFLYNGLTPKFNHHVFTRSEVIVLTNTPTNTQTNRFRWKHPTFFATLRRWLTRHTGGIKDPAAALRGFTVHVARAAQESYPVCTSK